MLTIYDLKTEYRVNPLGIDTRIPRFSWKLKSSERDTMQISYQIAVTSQGKLVWDTGEMQSEQSIHVEYQGEDFIPATRYEVKVTVKDNHGEEAAAEGWFETGLMSWENFRADWITHGFEDDLEPCAIFCKDFTLSGKVKSARIYASALGVYELALNGTKVGDTFFAPGWTTYHKRLQYQTYDITSSLNEKNSIEMTVGNGWYKGILGFHNQGSHYGNRTAAIAQIEIAYEDGTKETILTDASWKSTTGARRYSEIYHGEIIDYTFVAPEPVSAVLYEHPKDILTGQESEPVRITERLKAKELIITPKGEVVIDFGQNMTGIIEARLKCPQGTKVTVKHAEALDEKGCFYTTNLRTAKATDTFICSGGEDVFLPAFTFHGFRYIQVDGLGNNPDLENFTACALHSDLEQTGSFECSNEDVNRLWQNINWTLRSNFLDIPTDCPQRDERLGYTGDLQIFLPTAAFNKNVALCISKWLRDLKAEQSAEYGVPMAVPNILGSTPAIAIWHDAATIVPWTMWKAYGDKRFLEEQFESMKACVDYSRSRAGGNGLIQSGQQLGDWVALDMEKGPMKPATDEMLNLSPGEKAGSTDVYYIANAYYAYSTYIVAEAAEVLGHTEDAKEYKKHYRDILESFRHEYVTSTGRLISETQTGCALALHYNLVEEKDRKRVFETLLSNLLKHENHLTTGFIGTQFLCQVLSDNGAHETAGNVFLKEDCPSWLYSVKLGATTIWELWDGVNPDGSFNKYEMNSLNQYAFASIGDWMHKKLCGLEALEPGYKKSRIAPKPVKGIPSMKASLQTVYGELSCSVECKNKKFIIDVRVPVNTSAVLRLPDKAEEITVGSGDYHYEYATELSFEKEVYTKDWKLGKLLENPIASQMFREYASEMLDNPMFMQFAKERSILDISSVLPPQVAQLLEMILAKLNESEGVEKI
ncbi:MAG TPA: family 78 glycoside hydrolase catalytic domain [Clostridiales bacterium]|nr:family 78 glycoside hydrolase catalytic domain [Clostridiales bacterium]